MAGRKVALLVVGLVLLSGCWSDPWGDADRSKYDATQTAITQANAGTLHRLWTVHLDAGPARDAVQTNAGLAVNDDRNAYGISLSGQRLWTWTSLGTVGPVFGSSGTVLIPLAGASIASERTDQVDAATGLTIAPSTGRLLARRGDVQGRWSTFNFAGSPVPLLRVQNVQTSAAWAGAWCCGTLPPVTVGTKWLYHAGEGPISDETMTANGVRGLDLVTPVWMVVLGPSPGRPGVLGTSWYVPTDGTTAVPPVLNPTESVVYTGTDAGTVYAVDADAHTVLWSASLGTAVTASPALAGSRLYVPTASGDLVVLDARGCGAATCDPLWVGRTGSELTVQPAVSGASRPTTPSNGLVYTGSANGEMRAYPANGCGAEECTALWSDTARSRISGGPSLFADKVFYGTADGDVLAFAP